MSVRPLSRLKPLRGLAAFAALLVLWQGSAALQLVSATVLPSPLDVLRALTVPSVAREIGAGLAASLGRLFVGGALGLSLGLALGLALGLSRRIERAVGPSFHAFRQVPIFAWIPLLTAWLGAGDVAKVAFVALAAFKPVTMAAFEGVRSVPAQYLDVGRLMCFSGRRTLGRIVLPAAMPSIVGGLQLGLIHGWMAAIGAEYLMGSFAAGIGAFVLAARERLQTDQLFAGVVAIALVGLVMNVGLRRLGGGAVRWSEDQS